jgi:hypothetical protein
MPSVQVTFFLLVGIFFLGEIFSENSKIFRDQLSRGFDTFSKQLLSEMFYFLLG